MQPNWDYVKKTTLWHYEELIKKLNAIRAYPIIWQAYNHDMTHAAFFCRSLFPDKNIEAGEYPAQILGTIEYLKSAGILDWGSLLLMVATRDKCEIFISENNLKFEKLIDVLNYLLRWGFPFQTPSRELLEHNNPQEMYCYEVLKSYRLMNNILILEQGHTLESLRLLAEHTGLSLDFLTSLVHRADIARLPYVRRKTLLPLCGAGYNTLAKIAAADLIGMRSNLDAYFRRTQGKPWENFQSVIILEGIVAAAKALPVIMEE